MFQRVHRSPVAIVSRAGGRSSVASVQAKIVPFDHFFRDRFAPYGRRLAREADIKRIKIETDLENLCSVVMEESKDFDYEEEKPLSSRRRRSNALERHTCSRCSKSYIHAWHLKRHTRFECGQEPKVQCPYCAARMKQRGHVYRHIRQCHRGQNVYVIDLN
ncbi:testis-specific zinc finger protein topi [Megalopta genalis]|uniref:testis-specific zinc finger protein topi n=1 Tax=Megalopta genalis TaxID=115081 RepID=UPI0014434F70|nr:transcription factor Ovo-like 2 [Megalopta genalis]